MTNDQPTDFKPAFYAKYPVQSLSPSSMDELLANGYYRNGLDACAGSVRYMGGSWASALMLRVRLRDFEWKKRLRKLLRNNAEKFQFQFQLFQPTPEKEALWQQFKSGVHGWQHIPSLETHLLRGQPATSFNTWELGVYEGTKLVAISIFDRGERSISSLEAAYDTAYRKFSLGVYTMLLEIEFCQNEGFDFYYPGFFPKDNPMFEYKLRPGNIEFFRVETRKWLPLEKIASSDWKLDEVEERLGALKLELKAAGFATSPAYNHCTYRPTDVPALQSSSLHLLVPAKSETGANLLLFISWNLWKKGYEVFEGQQILPHPKQKAIGKYLPHHFFDVQHTRYFGCFQTPDEVLQFMQKTKAGITSAV